MKPDFVGWSGLGPIAMFIENVLGIDVDVPNGRIRWDVRLPGEHGIRRLSFGAGRVDLLCQKRPCRDATATVRIEASVPLRLMVRRGEAETGVEVNGSASLTV